MVLQHGRPAAASHRRRRLRACVQRVRCRRAETLRRYHELCVALGESEFFNETISFTVKSGPAERSHKLTHAGPAPLRSVMLDMRQLWMKGERTHLPSLRNRLRRNALAHASSASAEAVTQLDGIGGRYTEASKETMMRYADPANPMVSLKDVTAEQVIDDWLYAGAVHWDEERAARVRLWSRDSYEFFLSKALYGLCDVYWELDILVQGILAEPSLQATSC
jgi:hypothetical protein